MKNVILAVCATLISFAINAQDIAVHNMSGCDAVVTVYANDFANTSCTAYVSNSFTVSGGGGSSNESWTNFATNVGWTGTTPGSGARVTGFLVDYATSTSCSSNPVTIWFNSSCGSINCANRVYCSGCSTNANPKACPAIPAGGPFAGAFLCVLQDLP